MREDTDFAHEAPAHAELVQAADEGLRAIEARLPNGAAKIDGSARASLQELLASVDAIVAELEIRTPVGAPDVVDLTHDGAGAAAEVRRLRARVTSAIEVVEPDVDAQPAPSELEPEPVTAPSTRAQPPARARARRRRPAAVAAAVLPPVGALLVLFIAFEFAITGVLHSRAQQDLEGDLSSRLQIAKVLAGRGPVSAANGDVADPRLAVTRGAPLAMLEIDRLGLHQVVVEGTGVEELNKGPGHFRTTPWPGHPGNSVIAAHRTIYGGPFSGLDQLQSGDAIEINTIDGAFVYEVAKSETKAEGDTDVFSQGAGNLLTLVTSNPAYAPSGRLVVTATLRGDPFEPPDTVVESNAAAPVIGPSTPTTQAPTSAATSTDPGTTTTVATATTAPAAAPPVTNAAGLESGEARALADAAAGVVSPNDEDVRVQDGSGDEAAAENAPGLPVNTASAPADAAQVPADAQPPATTTTLAGPVVAAPTDAAATAAPSLPQLDGDELGLGRDTGAWRPLLFWGALLLAAYVGSQLLYRRWRRWSTWLITTPVLVTFAFLSFEAINRLLPSTL